ncbi:MAG: DNA repair protein RecO [Bacteroidota bacterium]
MIRKTEAIVLNARKFGDSSLIASMYTRAFGRQNYLIKGYRSSRAKKKYGYFQPMSIIDIVFYYKETRDLQLITETSNRYFYRTMQTQPVRITLGMVVVEIFHQAVKEEEPNDPLFLFLQRVLVVMDQQEGRLIHLFLHYLVHLTRYLGFFPRNEAKNEHQPVYFNLRDGILQHSPGTRDTDRLIARLCDSTLESSLDLRFGNAEKNEMINTLLQYYLLHVEGFRIPESLKVLQEVFR